MILFEDRASIVLYNVLVNISQKKFLLPLNICPIVPDTFLKAKKEFIFVDIELENLCMDTKIVFELIKQDTTIDGVLFVKTFGIEFDIQPFYQKIKEFNQNIFVIDDMCPCIQQFEYNIENSYANLALFSSGYSKYVDIGYGGYGFLKDSEFQNVFQDKSKTKCFLQYRDNILEQIILMNKHKYELNSIYETNIPEQYHLGSRFNNWRFSILVDNKDDIIEEIFKSNDLFASSHYPQIDYNYTEKPMQNTNTEKIHRKIINLFNDFRFTKDKAYMIVKIINKYSKDV